MSAMRIIGVALALWVSASLCAQTFAEAEDWVVRGEIEQGVQRIEVLLARSSDPDSALRLLWLHGYAHGLEGRYQEAKKHFLRLTNHVEELPTQAHRKVLYHTAKARIAYYEILSADARNHADSALHWLQRCSDDEIAHYRLFHAWLAAAQAYKQLAAQKLNAVDNFANADRLTSKAIAFLERNKALPPFYLADAWHIRGNSFTDRTANPQAGLPRSFYLAEAKASYDTEIAILKAHYGHDHGRIPLALFVKGLAYEYTGSDFRSIDSVFTLASQANLSNNNVTDRLSQIQCLKVHYEILIEQHEHLEFDEFNRRCDTLSTHTWRLFNAFLSDSGNVSDSYTLSLHNNVPAVADAQRAVLNAEKGRPFSTENLFTSLQYVKAYDVYQQRSQTPLPQPVVLQQWMERLPQRTLFLDLFCAGNNNGNQALVAIDRTGAKYIQLPSTFTETLELWHAAMALRTANVDELGFELFSTLNTQIDFDNYDEIVVCFSQWQKHVPFEALPTSPPTGDHRTTRYLVHSHRISYSLSSSLYDGAVRELPAAIGSYVPRYARSEHLLPFSADLASEMADRCTFWTSISDSSIASALTHPSPMLHLALHGSRTSGHKSVHTNLETDAEALRTEAINELPIHAKYVVLNACHSAEGRMVGLFSNESPARALLMAGAAGVVSNAWAVDDFASSEVLREFYHEMFNGASSGEALASAKRKFIQSQKSSRAAHPFYWAAHMQYGQSVRFIHPSPKNNPTLFLIAGILLGSTIAIGFVYFYVRRKRVPKASPR